jgi:hypothetical protein
MFKEWPKDATSIIVSRIDDPYLVDVPGSQEIDCWNCERKCMISKATLDISYIIANSIIVCVQCIRVYCDAHGKKMVILPRSKEQKQELKDETSGPTNEQLKKLVEKYQEN